MNTSKINAKQVTELFSKTSVLDAETKKKGYQLVSALSAKLAGEDKKQRVNLYKDLRKELADLINKEGIETAIKTFEDWAQSEGLKIAYQQPKVEKSAKPLIPNKKAQKTVSNPLKAVNKFNPKKAAINDQKTEGIDPDLMKQFAAFLEFQKQMV